MNTSSYIICDLHINDDEKKCVVQKENIDDGKKGNWVIKVLTSLYDSWRSQMNKPS